MGQLNGVSKCIYSNEKIVKYEHCICTIEEYADLHHEEYHYENNKLVEVTIFEVTPLIDMYEEYRYTVEYGEKIDEKEN